MSATATFAIARRPVGDGGACLVVGEVAQAHDGSLGTAHAYIDAVAAAGADAVKFQTHIAAEESTRAEPWRVPFSRQDVSRYDYWRRMEFNAEQWAGLAEHARGRGLLFLSSPFSLAAADLLERVGVPAWKVGSGEVSNLPLLARLARTRKPVLVSSGMSPWSELDRAVETVRAAGAPIAVLQCTTAYPCPPERLGLNVLAELRERYGCPVGVSDHSGTIWSGVAAAVLGANVVEVHVALSRDGFGPDLPASVTTGELRQLVEGIRFVERALAHRVDKEREAAAAEELRKTFGKNVVAARDLAAGDVLSAADLALKKAGGGLPPERVGEMLGRRLRRAVAADEALAEEDLA